MFHPLKIRLRYVYLLVLVYWMVLFVLTHVPGGGVGGIKHIDKVAHFVAYLGLAFLLTWALQFRQPLSTSMIAVLAIAVVYALLDEGMQMFVPGRTADLWDVTADVCGAITGIGFFVVARATVNRSRSVPGKAI